MARTKRKPKDTPAEAPATSIHEPESAPVGPTEARPSERVEAAQDDPGQRPGAGATSQHLRDPWVIQTMNLDGYKVRLQQSRKYNQMQIKFGEGRTEERPSDQILDFVKAPDGPEGVKFHWNNEDRAWGMRIDTNATATSRQAAEEVFQEVVKRIAQERGVGRSR
jgi:hypothetical protein